ncbi:hypothetical protein JCM10914A_03560 [Paenibacillus sp. JCM 10914]|uniref:LolA family protein n=1 Tax=Paenibacillus sp. JCM 10914 TaxID=1236974 RepID=UPI0003CC44DE|nr:DUF2092 domain-containing protein [Paenibacillus sp. JCM 10914]GAE07968.1 hypothetical protein JCM10914_4218 [Paenibacillus sp. JCM 10914]
MDIRNMWIIPLAVVTILSGCSGSLSASSEEIMSNVLQDSPGQENYKGEGEFKLYMNEELTDQFSFEEFASSDGKRKIITVDKRNEDQISYTLNDGSRLLIYEEGGSQAQTLNIAGTELPVSQTQKEQLTAMLERMKNTHTFEVVGEEELLGHTTYHLKITANSKDSLLGDMELWVDQKTWFLVKSKSISGDVRSEVTYTALDFTPTFTEDTFTLDLPEGVDIVDIEAENPTQTGTVKEAAAALGEPFLVFPDGDQTVETVEWNVYGGELNRTEVTVYYTNNGVPTLTLSVFDRPADAELNGNVTVRGMPGEYTEEIRWLSWDEGELRYGILIDHPDLAKEDVMKQVEGMVLSDEQ